MAWELLILGSEIKNLSKTGNHKQQGKKLNIIYYGSRLNSSICHNNSIMTPAKLQKEKLGAIIDELF